MHEFSTVDGFVEITEYLEEMIQYVANEPTVGLFYVQQHVQNAVPNLINLSNSVMEKSHEMTLHTEDLEDSITTLSSMKECGFSIAGEMIGDMKKSLVIMSTKQPKKGLIQSPSLGVQIGRTSSWGPAPWGSNTDQQQDVGRTGSYFSTVFKSAKQKAINFKWPQLDTRGTEAAMGEKPPSYPGRPLSVPTASASLDMPAAEADELPLSSPINDEPQEVQVRGSSSPHRLLSLSENYDEFRADKEARLKEWLKDDATEDDHVKHSSGLPFA